MSVPYAETINEILEWAEEDDLPFSTWAITHDLARQIALLHEAARRWALSYEERASSLN